MNILLTNIEFFTYEHEVWYRTPDGTTKRLTESDISLVDSLFDSIEHLYPLACDLLRLEYKSCLPNLPYFRFRIVARFIRCNFSVLDNMPDVKDGKFSNFECVPCPLRGECRHEGVICRPKINHQLSGAETRVMRLWHFGLSEDTIATALCISHHTVHNHIRNSYTKLGVHSRAEFVRIADINNLFNE